MSGSPTTLVLQPGHGRLPHERRSSLQVTKEERKSSKPGLFSRLGAHSSHKYRDIFPRNEGGGGGENGLGEKIKIMKKEKAKGKGECKERKVGGGRDVRKFSYFFHKISSNHPYSFPNIQ